MKYYKLPKYIHTYIQTDRQTDIHTYIHTYNDTAYHNKWFCGEIEMWVKVWEHPAIFSVSLSSFGVCATDPSLTCRSCNRNVRTMAWPETVARLLDGTPADGGWLKSRTGGPSNNKFRVYSDEWPMRANWSADHVDLKWNVWDFCCPRIWFN